MLNVLLSPSTFSRRTMDNKAMSAGDLILISAAMTNHALTTLALRKKLG